jgi:AraC-like DNA-binding protein
VVQIRQPGDGAWDEVRYVSTHRVQAGAGFDAHDHEVHQLCLPGVGVLVMGVQGRRWVLPRGRGLWIPAGVSHSVGTIGGTDMLSLWFDPATCPVEWGEPTVFEVDELLLGLVRRLVDGVGDQGRHRRTEAVLFDLLSPLGETVAIDLPLPADDRARQVAEVLVADPADARTLEAWGSKVGASDRTLLRAFQQETGLGFQEWRTRARVLAALPLLADGTPVSVVAGRVGFGSSSSLGAAFRRVLGQPPSAFQA